MADDQSDDPTAVQHAGTVASRLIDTITPTGAPPALPGSCPRYEIEKIDGTEDEIFVHIKQPGKVTARFRFDPRSRRAVQVGALTTENRELAAEGNLTGFVGRRLKNASLRATQYFVETRSAIQH